MTDDLRIIEHRGRLARTVHGLWQRWAVRPPRWRHLLAPLTDAVAAADLRRRLCGRGDTPARPFVVSVGALSSGGSGKTPVALDLAAELATAGQEVAILTRGYGSQESGPALVEPGDPRCGDEARLLASRLPDCVIVQSRDRGAGLAWLLKRKRRPDVVVVEDGHQSAGVARHLDMLILDRWRVGRGGVVPEAGLVLPWGPYRESASGADRAAVWLLPLGPDDEMPASATAGRVVLGFRRVHDLPPGVAGDVDMRYGVVSGVASPERFEADCTRLMGRSPCVAARFDDHAPYGRTAVKSLVTVGMAEGVGYWLTTAKDLVKLPAVWPADAPPLHAVEMKLSWHGEVTPASVVLSRLEA